MKNILRDNGSNGDKNMDYKMREIKESESVLSDFLYEAVFIPEGMEKLPKSIMEQLELQIYVAS